MSYHVYVARDGFKDNPVSVEDWLAAARQCDELVVEERKNRSRPYHFVALRDNTRAHLALTPYGLIHAQAPTKEQIAVMFKLAGLLHAGVYSEDLERYASVDDWEQKTRNYRDARDRRRAAYKSKRRKRILLFLLFVGACALVGWLIA